MYCADCHGDAKEKMKGVAARYPAFDEVSGRPVDLEQRINLCRTEHQRAAPLPFENHDLLALTVYVGRQSRGMPIARRPARLRLTNGRFCYARNWGE